MSDTTPEYETKPDPVQAKIDHTDEVLHNPGGLNVPIIAFVGVVGIVLVFVIMVATQAWFYSQGRKAESDPGFAEPTAAIAEYHAQQDAILNSTAARWVEGADDYEIRFTVPIDTAIEEFANNPEFRAFSTGK